MDNIASIRATGLEDEDNFFELVRQRAELGSKDESVRLTCDVAQYIARHMNSELQHRFLGALPKKVEDHVYPRLDLGEHSVAGSVWKLESELKQSWGGDGIAAARLAGAAGMTIAERLPPGLLSEVLRSLPLDLRDLMPERLAAA